MKTSAAAWVVASWTLVRVALAILLVLWCVLQAIGSLRGFELPGFGRIPGLLMIALGGGLVLWCGAILARVGILESPGDRMFPRAFVALDPFESSEISCLSARRFCSREFGLWLRSISILLFSAILLLIFHSVAVRIEEPGLERRLGSSYVAYKRTVGRWVPRIKTAKFE